MQTTLYRKYRPKTFSAVIGQNHITSTLINQIQGGRVSHAYLFSGARGTGKTTLARIFSRAINCEDKKNAPCDKCGPCSASKFENNLDIIEIDAASNNGVDDARDLREKIKYPPIHGKYKVYIIDEVHSLSGAAFNALLKTLEEPPESAVLILATTEPHKLPATILSRCLKFDFRLVNMQEIASLIKGIYKAEKKEFEDEAVLSIAAAAEGSVRDALSIADMAMGLSSGKLMFKDISGILGNSLTASMDLLEYINNKDFNKSIELANKLIEDGKSAGAIARELMHLSRDLMVAKTAKDVLQVNDETKERLLKKAEEFSIEGLAALVVLFSELENSIKYAVSPKIALEAAIIRAIKLYALDLNALDERILRLEKQFTTNVVLNNVLVDERQKNMEISTKSLNTSDTMLGGRLVDAPAEVFAKPPINHQSPPVNLTPQKLWGKILTFFRKNAAPSIFQVIGRHDVSALKIDKNVLTIYASRADYLAFCGEQMLEILKRALLNENLEYKIIIEKDSGDIDLEKEISGFYDTFGEKKVKVQK
ncbi:MAG: DNA polymerase III subunit gamma/tau [Firmicutes bacterium]|nr:DNA polymerase III subunit gamma/tau [Bacillota bacterium]